MSLFYIHSTFWKQCTMTYALPNLKKCLHSISTSHHRRFARIMNNHFPDSQSYLPSLKICNLSIYNWPNITVLLYRWLQYWLVVSRSICSLPNSCTYHVDWIHSAPVPALSIATYQSYSFREPSSFSRTSIMLATSIGKIFFKANTSLDDGWARHCQSMLTPPTPFLLLQSPKPFLSQPAKTERDYIACWSALLKGQQVNSAL